jgi:hypothetical protein
LGKATRCQKLIVTDIFGVMPREVTEFDSTTEFNIGSFEYPPTYLLIIVILSIVID